MSFIIFFDSLVPCADESVNLPPSVTSVRGN